MSADKKKCAATTRAGKPCPNSALPDRDFCFKHVQTPEERRENAARARAVGVLKKRREQEPLIEHRLLVERDSLKALYDLTRAKIDEPGFEGPDSVARGVAWLALIVLTRAYVDPDDLYTRMRDLVPKVEGEAVQTEAEWQRDLRRAWDISRMKFSELTGLTPSEDYPQFMLPDRMTMNEALAEGRAYLKSIYPETTDGPGELADTHVTGIKSNGERILIPRLQPNEMAWAKQRISL